MKVERNIFSVYNFLMSCSVYSSINLGICFTYLLFFPRFLHISSIPTSLPPNTGWAASLAAKAWFSLLMSLCLAQVQLLSQWWILGGGCDCFDRCVHWLEEKQLHFVCSLLVVLYRLAVSEPVCMSLLRQPKIVGCVQAPGTLSGLHTPLYIPI